MAHYAPTLYPRTAAYGRPVSNVPGWRRMVVILASITVIVSLLLAIRPTPATHVATNDEAAAAAPGTSAGSATAGPSGQPSGAVPAAAAPVIAPSFTPAVQYWAPQIAAWAEEYQLDPNLVATIMQVESCGDPAAISSAGAQGLFQVMPFHFQPGEDSLDPDTNARRGLAYFVERLQQTSGDIGRAFAGYNGGHVAAGTGWDNWLPETQRYYVWTTGIYGDIQQGSGESSSLQEWLQAGGASLCRQAAQRLGLQ